MEQYPLWIGDLYEKYLGSINIEAGAGQGAVLLRIAQRFSDKRFIGIEPSNKQIQNLEDGITNHKITNIETFVGYSSDYLDKKIVRLMLSFTIMYLNILKMMLLK